MRPPAAEMANVNPNITAHLPDGPPLADPSVPGIVVMCGLPGAGKSTAAKRLAVCMEQNGRPTTVVDVDDVRMRVLQDRQDERTQADPYGPIHAFRPDYIPLIYARMDTAAAEAIRTGRTVVYVGNPLTPEQRNKATMLADKGCLAAGVTFWIDTPPDIARGRAQDNMDSSRIFAGGVTDVMFAGHIGGFVPPVQESGEAFVRLQGGAWDDRDIGQIYGLLTGDKYD